MTTTPVIDIEGSVADWDGAEPLDILAICSSTSGCFASAIDECPIEPVRIEPSQLGYPKVVFDRLETGQVRVLLSARGTHWANFAYQFAHEFCHLLANVPRTETAFDSTAWIEEALCETASLFALRSMARTWVHDAPYSNWKDYASNLQEYAEMEMREPGHCLPAGTSLPAWLATRLQLLKRDEYRRADNAVVAGCLLPIFEANPDAWRAVRYLNRWEPVPFASHFDKWREATPSSHHEAIRQIEHRLTGGKPARDFLAARD